MPAVRGLGHEIRRGHCYDPALKHGFIGSQKQGIEVFRSLPLDAPLIVCEAVWQYSQQILPGLVTHRGPILTVANWSGEWPGLVGMLNLNAYLTKAGCYSAPCGAQISKIRSLRAGCGVGWQVKPSSTTETTSSLSPVCDSGLTPKGPAANWRATCGATKLS